MISKNIFILTLIATATLAQHAMADERITLGVKLLGTGWQGENGGVASSFNSTDGGQLAFSAAYSANKFFTAINLQSGRYQFKNSAPDQFTPSARISTSNVDVQQREFDLLAGYYFWESVSLFFDLKGVSNTWSNNDYRQNFGGLGLGAAAHFPLNAEWTGFGSIGFIGRSEIKDDNKVKVGEGSSGALELGAVYQTSADSTINMGIKFRNYRLDYLDNSTQNYVVNALFVGYNHSFSF